MTEHPPDPDGSGAWSLHEEPTQEQPAIGRTLATPLDQPDWSDGDDAHDADEEWVSRTTHGIRLAVPVAVLLAVVLVAGGFWGGAALEKGHSGGAPSSLASLASRFRSSAGSGATGATGFRFDGGLGRSAAAATGTISVVHGDTLYVRSSNGSLVKVTLTKSTTITRNADVSAIDLRPGDTVTVQGATSNDTVTATSVSATAPGVSSGFAGLFGGALGGSSATSPGTSSSTSTTPSLFGG